MGTPWSREKFSSLVLKGNICVNLWPWEIYIFRLVNGTVLVPSCQGFYFGTGWPRVIFGNVIFRYKVVKGNIWVPSVPIHLHFTEQ